MSYHNILYHIIFVDKSPPKVRFSAMVFHTGVCEQQSTACFNAGINHLNYNNTGNNDFETKNLKNPQCLQALLSFIQFLVQR